MIDRNVEVLHQLLKQIIIVKSKVSSKTRDEKRFSALTMNEGSMPLDEVKEIIILPAFDRKASMKQKDPDGVTILEPVLGQLKLFVTTIASMYRENPFHNFRHASHVVTAVTKFMHRQGT